MLKNLDPLLTPELLAVLAEMGHEDDLVLCDANFPAESVARTTVHGRPIRLVGVDAPEAARAILSVLPLEDFGAAPVSRMEVTDDPTSVPAVQRELQAVVDGATGTQVTMQPVERFAFYAASKEAYAVVATGERRFWGCFLFKKGVLPPAG
jgi:L-fucose mutarotase